MPTDWRADWKIMRSSVRGPTHERLMIPNQDRVEVSESEANFLIAAVSDGHGSAKSFRSDVGSRIAAQAAIDVLTRFFQGDWTNSSFSDRKSEVEFGIPKGITRAWRERVSVDLEQSPFTDDERERLVAKEGEEAFARITANPHLAYGATVLTVGITEEFFVYLQLGDGDILTVLNTGEVIRPLPGDDRLFANETTSLSSETAWQDFRAVIHPAPRGRPSLRLLLLATDGYSNSFRDDASFLKAGTDFLEILRADGGVGDVENHLEEWLSESARMSGDDVTLCLLYQHSDDAAYSPSAYEDVESPVECESAHMTNSEPIPISEQKGAMQLDSKIDQQAEAISVDTPISPRSQNGDHGQS